jgi:hypothetical protein
MIPKCIYLFIYKKNIENTKTVRGTTTETDIKKKCFFFFYSWADEAKEMSKSIWNLRA